MALRIIGIAVIVVAVVALSIWLHFPRSLALMAQGIGQQRSPVEFDIEFVGLDRNVSHVPVSLLYSPKTPIFGISEHYTSIISPYQIDTITRSLDVAVSQGRLRWSAPLGLTGLSNFRLQSVGVGDQGAPYALTATTNLSSSVDSSVAPRSLNIPSIAVTDGEYRYDGAVALWRQSGVDDTNPYAYSTRGADAPAQAIWSGLRLLHARVDLAPYPLATFVVPADWTGDGWKNEGFQLSRPHATLTDKALTVSPGISVPLPFGRECDSPPQFTVVSEKSIPKWSQIYGLWRPTARTVWEDLLKLAQSPDVAVRFVPKAAGAASLDRMESFVVAARKSGTYRLLAACPNSHFTSLGVTWIDVIAPPAPPTP